MRMKGKEDSTSLIIWVRDVSNPDGGQMTLSRAINRRYQRIGSGDDE